jgi:septal ring factor EnvC (AmiA/AmiB activator)
MNRNQFEELFLDSFDTFKVFYNLTAQESGCTLPMAPKTIWQILHHLIVWQDFQLNLLQYAQKEIDIEEHKTWIEEEQCDSQEKLNKSIATFHHQLERIREEISKFNLNAPELQRKLKVVQDLSVHLSFHIGEIILMRRITGNYPLPHQMEEFLK